MGHRQSIRTEVAENHDPQVWPKPESKEKRLLHLRPFGTAGRLERYLCHHLKLTKPWQHRAYDSGDKLGGGVEVARPQWEKRDTSSIRRLITDFFQNEAWSGGLYKVEANANDDQHGLTVADTEGHRWLIIMTAGDTSYSITILPLSTR